MSVSFGSWLQYNPDDFRGAALVAPGGDIVAAVNAAFRKRKAETGGDDTYMSPGPNTADDHFTHMASHMASAPPALPMDIPMAEEAGDDGAADFSSPLHKRRGKPSLHIGQARQNTMLVESGKDRMMSFGDLSNMGPLTPQSPDFSQGGTPMPPVTPASQQPSSEGCFDDPFKDKDYDPVYYHLDPRHNSYDVTLDLTKSKGLGLVLAPLIEGYPLATIIKRFSTSKDGSKGAAETAGVRMLDIMTHINGINICKLDHEATVDAMRKALKNKGKPLRMRLFARSKIMTERCDAMWAFFGKPRTEDFDAPPSKIKAIAWVDRYIIQNEVLHIAIDDRKGILRKYMMLWHPDRFMARFRKKIFSDEYHDAIEQKSQWVSQEISLAKVEVDDLQEAAAERVKKGVDHAQASGGSAVNHDEQEAKVAEVRVVHEGYLYKRALKSARNWRRRWFSLNNRGTLTYSTKPKAKVAKGTLELTDESRVELLANAAKKYAFSVQTRDHLLYCAAKSEREREAWMNDLGSTISWCTEGKPRSKSAHEAAVKKEADDMASAAKKRQERSKR